MLITQEALKAAGYRRYDSPEKGEYCRGLWQRVTTDADKNKLYFLDFYLWYFPDHAAVSVESALYREGGPQLTDFRVSLQIGQSTNLYEVERFYFELYTKLGCVPVERSHAEKKPQPRLRFDRVQ